MGKNPSIKVIVATHKSYRMPKEKMYLPVQVGAAKSADSAGSESDIGYTKDNTGDNISSLNPTFCELTGLYWAWKNLDVEYLGLAHYRRHFVLSKKGDKWENVLTAKQARKIFSTADIILPQKRKYVVETNYSHYINAHHKEPLDMAIKIIREQFPEYEDACHKIMKRSSMHLFNMFIMKKDKVDDYCEWLFDVLNKLAQSINIDSYSAFEARVFGRISEFLLDIWIEKNNYNYHELPVQFMERQNWIHKGSSFLLRKLKIRKVNERY